MVLPTEMMSHLGVAVAWSVLGASIGCLSSNFPAAKIFRGDSDSTVLEFSLAFLRLDSIRAGAAANSLAHFPFLFSAVPLLDAALAVMCRLDNRSSLLLGDRSHF